MTHNLLNTLIRVSNELDSMEVYNTPLEALQDHLQSLEDNEGLSKDEQELLIFIDSKIKELL